MSKDEYLDLFISEAGENLATLNSLLVKLEKNPEERECLNEIFRNAHNFKGIAATMGFEEMTGIAHEMENTLELIRQGKKPADKEAMDMLFQWCDLLEKKVAQVSKPAAPAPQPDKEAARPAEHRKENFEPETPQFEKREIQTVRVGMDQLDHLMNLTGELVINKARVAQIGHKSEDRALHEILKQLERLTDQMQSSMMQVRLVPIDYIFNRFPRMVRDVAAQDKKEVDLVLEGSDIGLDRTILDEINEPLVHLLRNAVSHGLETPEERKLAGKSPRGKIFLKAFRSRDFVVIEAGDDGRGMDPAKIRKAATEKKIVTAEEAAKLSDEETLMLITSPAFSTTETVTRVSGRGFGMSSVRKTVESFGGTLKIESEKSKGSKFTMTLPLSLAIIQALMVRLGRETYAVPLSNIVETMKVEKNLVRRVEDSEMVPYRGGILPLLRVCKLFGLPSEPSGERLSLVVVESGNRKAGLVVDELDGQQEIVLKALQSSLKNIKGIAGATVLANGKVAMIVDVAAVLLEPSLRKEAVYA